MATREPIRFQAAGVLRAQFLDDAGQPFQASGVEVLLYEPDLCPGPDLPTVSGLIPTYLGNGVFQVEVTGQAPGGTWIDHWRGYVLGALETVNLTYAVIDGGSIHNYPTLGPCENNLIEVILSSGIKSLEGNALDEEYSFFFTTEYTPYYADVRKARLEAGGLLADVPDYTLSLALLEASIEADCLTFVTTPVNERLFNHARREYTACKAAMSVAMNLMASGGTLKSKRLADFQVDYDNGVMVDLINGLMDTCRRWQGQVEAGGGLRKARDPQGVIKGEFDPDRPAIGRGWDPTLEGEKPIGNAMHIPSNKRRAKKTYRLSRSTKIAQSRKHGRGSWDKW